MSPQYPARHFGRYACVLQAIETLEHPTLGGIAEHTEIPESSIKEIFRKLTTEYGVRIVRIGTRRSGYYKISRWGVLNRDAVIEYQNLLDKDG